MKKRKKYGKKKSNSLAYKKNSKIIFKDLAELKMSAILHAITTSIENDRISDQLRNWFDMAVGFRRDHNEKFSPVLLHFKHSRCALRERCENYSTDRDMDIYMDGIVDNDDNGEIEVVEDARGLNHYDDKMVHAVYDSDYALIKWMSYFKVVDYRIVPVMVGSYRGLHLWRD